MTTLEFRAALAELGLTAYSCGTVLGISKRQAYRYSRGAPVPDPVARVLQSECARCEVRQVTVRDPAGNLSRPVWVAYRDGRFIGYRDTKAQAQAAALDLPR